MKASRIIAVARKEFIQIRRDPFSLAMAFLMPIMLLFIYAYAVTFDVDSISTVVFDQEKSSMSRELIAQFRESGYFRIDGYADRYDDVDAAIDTGKAKVVLVIPLDFSKKIERNLPAEVGIILDGSDSNTANIAQGYIAAIAERFPQRLRGRAIAPLIDLRNRVWYNSELKSRNFIIPGLIAVIMSVIIAVLTSLTIAREWDRGTMEQLISTPIKVPELLIGKIIPYFLVGFADTALSILVGTAFFGVPLRGSVPLLLSLSGIFLFGGLSFGVFVSIVGRTQLVASQMAMISSFLPAFMLSGFVFAISNMPEPLQIATYIVPSRYFVTILKGIFLKGSTLNLLLTEAALLTLFAVVIFLAAKRKFKKRVD